MIALIAVLLVIALVVSLVAVIIYSPHSVQRGDNTESSASTAGDNLLSRIQQLEGRMEQQGTNHSLKLLQESMESLEAQVQRQLDYDDTVSSQFLTQNNMLASHSSQIAAWHAELNTDDPEQRSSRF